MGHFFFSSRGVFIFLSSIVSAGYVTILSWISFGEKCVMIGANLPSVSQVEYCALLARWIKQKHFLIQIYESFHVTS